MLFWLVRVAKDFIELLSDSDKSGPLWHLFDTSSTNIGTSRPETSQNIQHCGIYITPIRNFDSFSLGSSVFGYTTFMLGHGSCRAHSIEKLRFFLELWNLNSLTRSTSALLRILLLFGLRRTSLKSSLTSSTILGMVLSLGRIKRGPQK